MDAPTAASLSLDQLTAVIFDLDGVLTDTARLHRQAWTKAANELFAELARGGPEPAKFTDDDYAELVDGKLRLDGARAIVRDRQLDLADGSPDDGPEDRTIAGFAARKDAYYAELLKAVGPSPNAGSIAFLDRIRAAGLRTAVVTASRHGREVLELAGIAESFDAIVDGHSADAMGLPSRPAPDTLWEAATRLGVEAAQALVVDDAQAGVLAGVAGGFHVVGIDRDHTNELTTAGADFVVADLSGLDVIGHGPVDDCYRLSDRDDSANHEGARESLFTLGNGYVATRDARSYAHDDGIHYPGTYFAGVYDRFESNVSGRAIEEEAIVNAPNWLSFSLSVCGGPWLGDKDLVVTTTSHELDLRRGLVERRFVTTDEEGRRTSIFERRFVSMANPHLAAMQIHVVADNWSGVLRLRTGIDGAVSDAETVEERLLGGRHLDLVNADDLPPNGALLAVRTLQSHVVLAEAMRVTLSGKAGAGHSRFTRAPARVGRQFTVPMSEGERVSCEKVVALYSSRDMAITEPVRAAREAATRAGHFDELLLAHGASWHRLWTRASLDIRDDTTSAQRLVNLHLFHLLEVASPHVIDHDVGLGARGLHGEGYLGHIFWDELFVLPMLGLRFPSLVRSLLAYRSRRLAAAKSAAHADGHRGAMFPWRSGSDGRDETPSTLFNPRSGRWMEDRSHLQRHVGLAIAYNFWQYFQATGDTQHLFDTGAEVILEIARYFADLARFDEQLGRFRIEGVMGPDEFHDGYPWKEAPGVDDNTYTNVMTAWLLERAVSLVELLHTSGREDVLDRIGFEQNEIDHFEDVSRRLHVPFIGSVLGQFEGFDRLEPIDLDAYRARYGDIGRLDLILEAEHDDVRRYQVAKQPDTLMLFYLFSAEELREILARLGYELDTDAIRATIEFYAARVTHGSSLSRVVYAWILSRLDRGSSSRYLTDALATDFADVAEGTTREGIHLGAMAGTVDVFSRCYIGLETRTDALWLNPRLPDELTSLSFCIDYRGHLLSIAVDQHAVEIACPSGPGLPVTLLVRGTPYTLHSGERVTHEFAHSAAPRSNSSASETSRPILKGADHDKPD